MDFVIPENKVKFEESLKNAPVKVRCTYAAAYPRPISYSNETLSPIRTYGNQTKLARSQSTIETLYFTAYRLYPHHADEYIKYVLSKWPEEFKYADLSYIAGLGLEYGLEPDQIAVLTGHYFIGDYYTRTSKRRCLWLFATLLYCDRAQYGWFRANDILPDITINLYEKEKEKENPPKKTNWLNLLLTGITTYNLLK